MKAKLLLMIAVAAASLLKAQTPVNRTIPVQKGQRITMHFDYPELIRISTWDKNEISTQGTVSINAGENDEAFVLDHSVSDNSINIRSEIRGLKDLPHRITVINDGQKMVFKNKEAFKEYQQENGKSYDVMSQGAEIDITLEIKVPRNMDTRVESVYGMVEVKDFTGPLVVEATYGGVDASLVERAAGEITAETNYGEIFTNLDTKFGGDNMSTKDFHTYVSAKPGTGPSYSFESKYGNVYIRKAVN